MPFHYFFPVPKLDRDAVDQTHGVELLEWLVAEGQMVQSGQAIASVQTRWAVLELLAVGDGLLGKQIFAPGTQISETEPIAVIYADGESLPYGRDASRYRVSSIRQVRPSAPEHRDRVT